MPSGKPTYVRDGALLRETPTGNLTLFEQHVDRHETLLAVEALTYRTSVHRRRHKVTRLMAPEAHFPHGTGSVAPGCRYRTRPHRENTMVP